MSPDSYQDENENSKRQTLNAKLKIQLNIMFRNFKILILLITFSFGCKNQKNPDVPDNAINSSVVNNPTTASSSASKDNIPVLQFEKSSHDFGNIIEGEKISFAFKFKNIGKGDLVIRAAQGSCGCTVPEYPKEAIKPGDGGIINVTFNSADKEGFQEKTVTVISNTMPNTFVLTITGNVAK